MRSDDTMKKKASCPTCGTRLSKLNDPNLWRTCNACNRTNPRKYPYCGWCASPMESTEMRRVLSQVAAPPGGWPSLASELVEVRFFMERGAFADAFELLAILRQRFPLHPELEEFTERARPALAADTGVHAVVDGVLAGSSSLSGTAVGRRPAPKWNAPRAQSESRPNATDSHTALRVSDFADESGESDERSARRRGGNPTERGHQPIAAIPVVPIIPPEARVAIPKRPFTKKRLLTHRFERGQTPQRDATLDAEPTPTPTPTPTPRPRRQDAAEQNDARHAPVEIREAPQVVEPDERERARAAGQFDVDDSPATRTTRPMPVADTEPLEAGDIEELAPAAGVLYSEPETEAAIAAEREAQIAAARRAAAKRARKAARRAAADALRESEEAAEAARLAVEEAVGALVDRPGAQTGRTHVGRPPEAPAVTGDTVVGLPPSAAPAVTGDTVVGAPPTSAEAESSATTMEIVVREAPEVRVETVVGRPPSAEPGYVPPRGLTLAVQALQPARPFDNDAPADGNGVRKKKFRGQGSKRSMKPRKRSGKLSALDADQQEAERQERARRRAARFGQGILGK